MATKEIQTPLTAGPAGQIAMPDKLDRGPRTGAFAWLLSRWWIAFAASSIAVVSGHLLIKAGLNALLPSPAGTDLFRRVLHEVLQPQVSTGLLIYIAGTICWMRAVSQKEISFLYPLSSVNYVLVVAISTTLFHEAISARRAAGVIVIVIGMILMIRQPGNETS
jgi:multidrug transporter EmrE-like cation transporter